MGDRLDDHTRLRLLYELGCAFAARIELDELVPLVVEQVPRGARRRGRVGPAARRRRRDELYFPYVADDDPDGRRAARSALRFPADRGIAGAVLAHGRARCASTTSPRDPRFYRGVDRETGAPTRALLSAPLHGAQGRDRRRSRSSTGAAARLHRRRPRASSRRSPGSVAVAIENARLLRAREGVGGAAARAGRRAPPRPGAPRSLRRDRRHERRRWARCSG